MLAGRGLGSELVRLQRHLEAFAVIGSKDLVIEDAFVRATGLPSCGCWGRGRATAGRSTAGSATASRSARSSRLRWWRQPRDGPRGGRGVRVPTPRAPRAQRRQPDRLRREPAAPGRSPAEVDAAIALLRHDTREMLDLAARGEMPTLLDRARYRRDQGFMTRLALRAVNRLMESSGGHALQDVQPTAAPPPRHPGRRAALLAALGRDRRAVRPSGPGPRPCPNRPGCSAPDILSGLFRMLR